MTRRILLATNCEYGQANVVLALAYELATRPNVRVAIASFAPLEKRVENLQKQLQDAGFASDVSFYLLPGRGHIEAVGITRLDAPHGTGVRNSLHSFRYCARMLLPWTESEYQKQLKAIEDIAHQFEPESMVVEWFLRAGVDVSKKLGIKLFVVTPNSTKDLIGFRQPRAAGIWKYPALSSGYPYPIPWSRLVPNAYINLRLISSIKLSSTVKKADQIRQKYNRHVQPILVDPQVTYLCPSTPDLDFPLVIPDNVVLCGPLVIPTAPIEKVDPELTNWINQAPTVLVNLGSHVTLDSSAVEQLFGGFLLVLREYPTIQILWKLKPEGDIQQTLSECTGDDLKIESRIRIVDWLHSEPFAILQHSNALVSVHHGGANSFFEAVLAGVPQLILPVWYDTYEYASRVEWLGIGKWGSRTSAPKAEAFELAQALSQVLSSEKMRAKAKSLSEACRLHYTGRIRAADEVLGAT